jgi:F-type H+-transporting ATPase subunit a
MRPVDLITLGPFVITNSMVVSWCAALVVIALAQYATRKIALVPDKPQNFAETLVETLATTLEPILGYDGMRKTFWFFASIFIFIVSCNLFSLLPIVGSVGHGEGDAWYNLEITRPWLRGANADVNMTAAMAITFFVLWFFWSLQAQGVGGFIKHIFGSKAPLGGIAGFLIAIIFVFVGLIEVVSIMFRPVSLTFRLFGNIYGGESMLEALIQLSPHFAWLILIPFYCFELLVAVVQAMVFCLLTAAFTGMMIKHEEGPGERH